MPNAPIPTRRPTRPPLAVPAQPGSQPAAQPRESGRVSLGNDLLDNLLQGGVPRGSSFLLMGPSYSGKEVVAASFAQAAAREPAPLIVVLTSRSPARFRDVVAGIGHDFAQHEEEGLVAYVDCHSSVLGAKPTDPHVASSPDYSDPESLRAGINAALARVGRGHAEPRVLIQSATDLVLRAGPDRARGGHTWLQRLLGDLRAGGATCLLTVEAGIHQTSELELLRHLSDGSVEFREADDARMFLRVRGLGGGVTRDWVEYVSGPRGLDIVGSFTERKIR